MKYWGYTILVIHTLLIRGIKGCSKFVCKYNIYNNNTLKERTSASCSERRIEREGRDIEFSYILNECEVNERCNISLGSTPSNCYREPERPSSLLPGEACIHNTDCYSPGSCLNGLCRGLQKGENCSFDQECDLLLFCDGGFCHLLGEVGTQCHIYKKCKEYLVCNMNICTIPGSLPNEQLSTSPLACNTYYNMLFTSDSKYHCVDAPTLKHKIQGSTLTPPTCQQMGGQCSYSLTHEKTTQIFTQPCRCGLNKEGNSYCPLGRGDMKEQVKLYTEWLQGAPTCHISTYRKGLCESRESRNKPYWKAYVARLELEEYWNYVDNPVCVRALMTNDYHYAYAKAHDGDHPHPTPPTPNDLSIHGFSLLQAYALSIGLILLILAY